MVAEIRRQTESRAQLLNSQERAIVLVVRWSAAVCSVHGRGREVLDGLELKETMNEAGLASANCLFPVTQSPERHVQLELAHQAAAKCGPQVGSRLPQHIAFRESGRLCALPSTSTSSL